MMTSRERVLCALNHEEPDRVPLFIGTSGATTLLAPGYERLKAYMGVEAAPRVVSRSLQYARMDEEVLLRLGSDGRILFPEPAVAPADSPPAAAPFRDEQTEDSFVDEWGIRWVRRPGVSYFEVLDPPLASAGVEDLARYPWPDLTRESRFRGYAEEGRRLREKTPYAVVVLSGATVHEQIYLMRGLDRWLIDLIADEEFAHALLRKMTDLMISGVTALLARCGEYVDVIVTGDDLGTTNSLMMSPALYRKMLKPYQAELLAAIKKNTTAKIFFHSDGAIYPVIGDLIEIGADILNPVQVSARGMGDTARLKRELGDRLSFCGAIDTNQALPRGTPGDVRREVRRRISDLGPGGGYIVASVHCIQPDVPPENVLAMCDEVVKHGHYPLPAR
ncbi:MAG: hypothetical protein JW852_00645 [Spirochaetales bacterium]|nr:hypothetical protein [Spirochaetales bacterium]